uniref:G-protein coupled receptors family 1 profile domain-containing protein n=1 Tax=Panagrolaimus sp. JU765 TaxID=591449 RepID=A0AC34QQN0_9BILA
MRGRTNLLLALIAVFDMNGFHSMSPSPNLFWIQVAATIGICFQVVVPLFLLTFTNGLLLFYLKTRNKFFQIQKWNPSKNSFDSSNALESDQDSSNQKSKIWSRRHLINERRITITVFSIVCCFVITNLPSSFIVFWFYIIKNGDVYRDELDYAMVLAAIIVVVIGKAANFFLLCHSSANFRRQLKHKFLDPFRIFLRLGKSSIPLKNPIQPQIHYAKLDKIEIQC